MKTTRHKTFRVPEMEGAVARWYARNRRSGNQLAECRRQASRLTADLPDGATVLEVAPGPGYHAVEVARLGRFHVTGLDISRTFVEIAGEYARQEGVSVDFRHGDVSRMPFDAESFDLVVCQAAFKNFTEPVTALDEMYRVLRPGGTAVIQDMRKEASRTDIQREVAQMRLSPLNTFMTKSALAALRRRAYARPQFAHLATRSAFGGCTIHADGIGIDVRLTKPT